MNYPTMFFESHFSTYSYKDLRIPKKSADFLNQFSPPRQLIFTIFRPKKGTKSAYFSQFILCKCHHIIMWFKLLNDQWLYKNSELCSGQFCNFFFRSNKEGKEEFVIRLQALFYRLLQTSKCFLGWKFFCFFFSFLFFFCSPLSLRSLLKKLCTVR